MHDPRKGPMQPFASSTAILRLSLQPMPIHPTNLIRSFRAVWTARAHLGYPQLYKGAKWSVATTLLVPQLNNSPFATLYTMKLASAAAILSLLATTNAGTVIWDGSFSAFSSAADFDKWYDTLTGQVNVELVILTALWLI